MTKRTLTRSQLLWCRNYRQSTMFEPLIDDFLAGEETFEEAARKSIEWFEDWANDATLAISRFSHAEEH